MQSRIEKSAFGSEKTVHYDDHGNKIGETRLEKGVLGRDKLVHYDKNGTKIGESWELEGALGGKRLYIMMPMVIKLVKAGF